jgi:hypothetical protein
MGSDPIHALTLCLRTIDAVISAACLDKVADIRWLSKGDKGGFFVERKKLRKIKESGKARKKKGT